MEMGSLVTKVLGAFSPHSQPTSAARVLPKELQLDDYSVIVAGGTSGMGLEVSKVPYSAQTCSVTCRQQLFALLNVSSH